MAKTDAPNQQWCICALPAALRLSAISTATCGPRMTLRRHVQSNPIFTMSLPCPILTASVLRSCSVKVPILKCRCRLPSPTSAQELCLHCSTSSSSAPRFTAPPLLAVQFVDCGLTQQAAGHDPGQFSSLPGLASYQLGRLYFLQSATVL